MVLAASKSTSNTNNWAKACSLGRTKRRASPLLSVHASHHRALRTEALHARRSTLYPVGKVLTRAISAAIVGLYAEFYGHDRTTASTYINDNVVVCILEGILTSSEHP